MKRDKSKPKPIWMLEREQQIRGHIVIVVVMVLAVMFGFASGAAIDYAFGKEPETVISKPDCGLYAGFTSIDWNVAYDEMILVEEEETEIVTDVEPEIDEYERELLAHLIYAEAGDNSYKCLLYVGSVIINRVNSTKFPNSIYDVIYEGNGSQYPTIKWMWGRKPSENAYKAAEECLMYGSALPEDVLAQTGFYIDGSGQYQGWEHYEKVDTEYFSRCVWEYR